MITKYQIITIRNSVLVTIKRSNRKTLGLEVKPTGEVLARVPMYVSDRDIKKFIDSHKKWIIEKCSLVKAREKHKSVTTFPPYDEFSRKERDEIKEKITQRVQYYSLKMDVTYNRVSVRNQKTRWGSCSIHSKKIRINLQLAAKPEECIEYVLVHELCHLLEPSHNERFYYFMDLYLPDWENRKKKLNV